MLAPLCIFPQAATESINPAGSTERMQNPTHSHRLVGHGRDRRHRSEWRLQGVEASSWRVIEQGSGKTRNVVTPSTRIVLRAELVARAVPLQPVLCEYAGPARRTAEEVVLALTDASHRSDSAVTWRTYEPPLQRGADRARSRARGGYAASRRWRRSTPCSTCTALVVSPRQPDTAVPA